MLDSNKKVTKYISTGISFKKNKPFDSNFEPTMSNLGNGKGILKFTNFILIQRINFSFYRNFIINLHIAYELNTSQRNSNTNFTLKNCIFGTVKLTRNADKSKFTYNG